MKISRLLKRQKLTGRSLLESPKLKAIKKQIEAEEDGSIQRRKDENDYFGEETSVDISVVSFKIDEEHWKTRPFRAEFLVRIKLLGFFENKYLRSVKWIVGKHSSGAVKDIVKKISDRIRAVLYSRVKRLNGE